MLTAAPFCSHMQSSEVTVLLYGGIIYSLPSMIDTPQLCTGNHNSQNTIAMLQRTIAE